MARRVETFTIADASSPTVIASITGAASVMQCYVGRVTPGTGTETVRVFTDGTTDQEIVPVQALPPSNSIVNISRNGYLAIGGTGDDITVTTSAAVPITGKVVWDE